MVEFTIYAGEVLDIEVPLTNADGTPYSVTGTVVLRIAAHWSDVLVVEQTVDIVTDADTPIVQFADTGDLSGLYSVQLWEDDQPLMLQPGLLWVKSSITAAVS